MDQKVPDWRVLLVGGHSGSGKTTVAAHLATLFGVPWMMVDDLRLAFQRANVTLPKGTSALYFDKTPYYWRRQPEELLDALIAVGEVLSAPLEVVIENHVDQHIPVVIEGDGILPSLLSRPSVAERAEQVRTVFLVEPDESEVLRQRAGSRKVPRRHDASRIAQRGTSQVVVRTVARLRGGTARPAGDATRPWDTLVERLLEHHLA